MGSKILKKKKQKLQAEEIRLRNELEEVTNNAESAIKKILIITVASAAVGFIAYKTFYKSDKKKKVLENPKNSPQKAKSNRQFDKVKDVILEKLVTGIVGLVAQKISTLDNKHRKNA